MKTYMMENLTGSSTQFLVEDSDLKYGDLTRRIIGCAMEVHRVLGNGFQEVIYQRALAIELKLNVIAYCRETEIPLYYKEKLMGKRRIDFLIENRIIAEIKAIIQLEPVHVAQALNYLEAANMEIGLLINFGSKSLEFRRLHNDKARPANNIM